MFRVVLLKVSLFLVLIFLPELICSQSGFHVTLFTTTEVCLKANAAIEISGTDPADTISIAWSSGQTDIKHVFELTGGDYSVYVKVKHKDSLVHIKDTTLYFSIEKELCSVTVDKYFSPNGDNYHDLLGVSNTAYYPNFELNIFNKWGQQVHMQKRTYTPWDGTWNGIDLPDGAYYYVFFYDSSQKTKHIKGDITILR